MRLKTTVRTLNALENMQKTKIKAMTKYETFLMSPWVGIMTQTFQDYCLHVKSSPKRRWRQWNAMFLCALSWSTVIKFYTSAAISDHRMWQYIGDPFYLTNDRILFNLVIGSIALNAALMRTYFLISESSHRLSFIREFWHIKAGDDHYLSKSDFKKLKIRCGLSQIFMLKQIPVNALVTFSVIYGYYALSAYLRQDYEYGLWWSVLWWVLTTIAAWVAASMQGIAYSIIYLCQYYLKLRFRQIGHKIVDPFYQNSRIFVRLLVEHNRSVKLTEEYNEFLCVIIAINYLAATLAVILLFYTSFYGYGDPLFRAANGLIAINKTAVIWLATHSCAQFSNQVHSLYIKLNSLFICMTLPVDAKIKTLSTIERLGGPPIGFYCYDVFAFNAYLFFKYVLGCVSAFLMTVSTIRTFNIY